MDMRALAWFSAGFALVCAALAYLSLSLALPLAVFFALAALSALLAGKKGRKGALWQVARRAVALSLGGLAAAGWMTGWSALYRSPALALADTTQTVSGTVTSFPQSTSIGGCSMTLTLDSGHKVLMSTSPDWGDLLPGDRVTFTASFQSSQQLYGEETYYYAGQRVFLRGYCHDAPLARSRPACVPLRLWPLYAARALKGSLSAALGDLAGLSIAVLTGDKSGLSDGVAAALSRTGTSHAVAVSGMHLSFLLGVCLSLSGHRRRLSVCFLPLLLFYALLAGASPSTLRSVVMYSLLLLSPMVGRDQDGPTGLGLALLLLLLENPWAVTSVSLQLSFSAVAGIFLLSRRLDDWFFRLPFRLHLRYGDPAQRPLVRLIQILGAALAVTFGASFFTQPLLCLYFGQVSLVFPLANLLILWAVSLLFALSLFLGLLGMVFPPAAAFLAPIPGLVTRYILWVVEGLGSWTHAAVDTARPAFLLCVAAVYLFVLVRWLRPKDKLRLPIPLACLAVLLSAAFLLSRQSVYAQLTVTALDVGQGASTILLSAGSTCVVDCGGSGGNAGDDAADYFAAMGVDALDLLVLTHFDSDHFNGVEQLFYRMEVSQVAIPDVATAYGQMETLLALCEREGAIVTYVTELRQFELGEATLTLYPPLGSGTSNEEGLFALCSAGDFDVLITGDADYYVEKMLLRYYNIPDTELLLVGHHGSRWSTSEELLEAVSPELAILSVGYNTYGHPAQEVLDRLEARDITLWRTDENGIISIEVRSDGYVVQTQKRS